VAANDPWSLGSAPTLTIIGAVRVETNLAADLPRRSNSDRFRRVDRDTADRIDRGGLASMA
jgi:hypothetical protein